ncbi:MAG TPA: AAA family ATPase [Frankiaceae bacterium]|jgi:predicted ABC-type ATPase|nr:AAA family ATPase [Frankiaceae bacterium]
MRLDLVVGPNGAGKSTFVELILAPNRKGVTFVNADVIAAQRWPEDPAGRAYEAAEIAAQTRARLLEIGEPFIAETVFSYPSKLDLLEAASAAGYVVELQVLLVPEELAVQRVAFRVASGGHNVPERKIRERFSRIWPLVVAAIGRADVTHVWDNSGYDGPQEIALFAAGMPIGACRWPAWTPSELTAGWPM